MTYQPDSYANAQAWLTFRFLDGGCARWVGEESRSAMRVLTARLRSLRRVGGVGMSTLTMLLTQTVSRVEDVERVERQRGYAHLAQCASALLLC